jgi:hypothetical protein
MRLASLGDNEPSRKGLIVMPSHFEYLISLGGVGCGVTLQPDNSSIAVNVIAKVFIVNVL